MPVVKFFAATEQAKNFWDYPEPSKNFVADWYKKQPRYLNNENKAGLSRSNGLKNTTVKACMPFQDAMLTGYIWALPMDLQVTYENDMYFIQWSGYTEQVVDTHNLEQISEMPNPVEGSTKTAFKFNCPFIIKPPKGYSILFTHPLNRNDLPFRTFSGVVESDIYPAEVNFPFQFIKPMEKDESLIIPAGTPLVQFIPIKREKWTHKTNILKGKKLLEHQRSSVKMSSTIVNAYKKLFWQKKSYN
jgi:hypothetical protein